MNNSTTEEKVVGILEEILNLEDNNNKVPEDLSELDSLNLLELISRLEEEFNIELTDSDVEFKNISSVKLMAELVESKTCVE